MFKRLYFHSLQSRLMLIFSVFSLIFALIVFIFTLLDTYYETEEFHDELLKQTALYIHPNIPPQLDEDEEEELQDDAQVFISHPKRPSDVAWETAFQENNQNKSNNYYNIQHDGQTYRAYVRPTEHGNIIVWQNLEYRQELALKTAFFSALPLLLLIPLMNLMIFMIIRHGLKPIHQLSNQLASRHDTDFTPLSEHKIPKEIKGFIQSINQMMQRTDRAMQQQQRFIADAAHELRTPMTALSIQAERLQTNENLPIDLKQQINDLLASIRRNRYLLEQLLQHARAQAPEQQRPKTAIAIQPLFQQIINDVLPITQEKQQDIGVTEETDKIIQINELDIYQMIKILVDNAIRYTPTGSQIDLSVAENQQFIIFHIEDNGLGIPAHQREQVFEPFFRILGTGQDGTGLGLSIAQTIAQRYGGRIELSNSVHFPSGLLARIFLDKNHLL